jgi:23S rRNA pseudouridine1911/1915/1917 synthase
LRNDGRESKGTDSSLAPRETEITAELSGHRLDYVISRELGISRSYAQKLIRDGLVGPLGGVNGGWVKPSLKARIGERYAVTVPPPEKLELEPEDIGFGVVYSDEDIIVVDKPAGLVVHPSPGHYSGTLVHGLLYRFPEFGNIKGVMRPGIVHRLDAATSGLMVVARGGFALEKLYGEFKSRRVEKTYLLLCHGIPKEPKARIDAPIGRDADGRRMTVRADGRNAVTDYEVLWSRGEYSLCRCVIHTGRTHQIRVHMKAAGHPLVGDTLYAAPKKSSLPENRVFLHSWKLSFAHPRDGRKVSFRSFMPGDLRDFLSGILSGPRATCRP